MKQAPSKCWIGVDLSQKSFYAAAAPEGTPLTQWGALRARRFDNSPAGLDRFAHWLSGLSFRVQGICVESTGRLSIDFAWDLRRRGVRPGVSIVNPARPRHLARSLNIRDKTDPIDAVVSALWGLYHRPRPFRPDPRRMRLRELWRLRSAMVDRRVALQNRLEETRDPQCRRLTAVALRQDERLIQALEKRLARVVKGSRRMRRDHELLCSIPGIGNRTAWMILAELDDLRLYSRNQLVAFCGLFPRRFESGTSVKRKPALARGGGGRIRKALYMPALSLRRTRTPLNEFAQRLIARGQPRQSAVVALMRKLLLVARAVLVAGRPYDSDRVGNAAAAP